VQLSGLTVIDKIPDSKSPAVKPNPFTNELTITSDINDTITFASVEGITLFSRPVSSGETTLSLDRLSRGIYILYFINQNKNIKILKL